MNNIAVALEIGPKRRVFAQALEWIGWCRAGKDEATALNHLVTSGLRYARVAERAGLTFVPPPSIEALEIVERMPGTATTDFGAPGVLLSSDLEPLEEGDIERNISLLTACWATFDDVLQRFPTDLHDVKPERGRSPSAIRLHLLETERMHLSVFGPLFDSLILPMWLSRKLRFGNSSLRSCGRCPARKFSFLAAGMAFLGLRALQCADRHGTRSIMPWNSRNGGTGEQRLTVRHPPETPLK